MKRKTQTKKRNSFLSQKEEKNKYDDIQMVMEEIQIEKENRTSKKQKDNNITYNSKFSQIKKRNANETKISKSLNIFDVDMPMTHPNKDNNNSPKLKQNKSVNKEISNKKTKKSEKNLAKNKRKDKTINISLEESDNDSEIKVTSIEIIEPPPDKNRNTFEFQLKKNEKQNIKTSKDKKGKKMIKCELSSEEIDDENKKENISRKKIEKRNNKRKKNSGFQTNIKSLTNNLNNTYNGEIKPYSSIKIIKTKSILKNKINNYEKLLGRKRNFDKGNNNSKSPNKKIDNSKSSESESKLENKSKNKNEKHPSKNEKEKIKAGTHEKNRDKKNVSFDNLSISDILNELQNNTNKKYYNKELEALDKLINYYSLDKVIDALCKPKLDTKNKLDLDIQILINSCSKEKLPFYLIKFLFVYFQTKINDKNENENKNEKEKNNSTIKRSSSVNIISNPIKINSGKKGKFGISESNSPTNKNNVRLNEMNINEEELNSPKFADNLQEINSLNNNNKKSVKKETKIEEIKERCIGSHYNKAKDGKIYKYQVYNLNEKGNAIYVCYDDNCCGMGNYNIETQKFIITRKHNLRYEEHDYIINLDKDRDSIFFDLLKYNKNNAQVIKENGVRNVIIY